MFSGSVQVESKHYRLHHGCVALRLDFEVSRIVLAGGSWFTGGSVLELKSNCTSAV